PTLDKFEEGDKAYVSIGVGEDGYAYFMEAFKNPPKKGDYIDSKVLYSQGVEEIREGVFGRTDNSIGPDDRGSYKMAVAIKAPANMCKYFINEDYAMTAERVFQKERGSITIGVRILDGEARMVDVYVKGKPLMDCLTGK
ncbi:MAG: hypothetical protein HRT57_03030, partial [Crocinitomicaceae bacterium]|nr:hypothetical protein [Crocinitomicaceae bacterium]